MTPRKMLNGKMSTHGILGGVEALLVIFEFLFDEEFAMLFVAEAFEAEGFFSVLLVGLVRPERFF